MKRLFNTNKPVAAIYHGPLLITTYGPAKGRKMTTYGILKADVEGAGATYLDQEVVVDGNLITRRAWPDLPAIIREFVKR